jgi:aminotransferase
MHDLASGVEGSVHLEIGEPDFPTPPHIIEAAKRSLDEGYTHYSPNAGDPELRERIAEKVSRNNKIDANPNSEIIVTCGAMQAISSAILVTINPGDEVIIPDPGYESFSRQVRFASGTPVPVQVKEEEHFLLDPQAIEKTITKKSKMIILNTPSNPTGSVMSRDNLERIAEVVCKYNLLVISDEIYEKITFDGVEHVSFASLPEMAKHTISVFAFSKTYAMTGWRVGYAIGPKEIIGEMTKIQEFYVTCAPTVCQRAALAALTGPQSCVNEMVQEYRRRRDFLYDELVKIRNINCFKPQGAFYLFPNISHIGMRSEEAAQALLEKSKIVTTPGRAFGEHGDNFIRMSLGTSMENLELAAERIRNAF